ncbi:DUF433 domain-containing protein [Rhodopila sp.]|uniref:DUF433 domain-containing protein n=1 Tax=Rhodopila sp. TaxID=2480087 RepID=UPI003D10F8A6
MESAFRRAGALPKGVAFADVSVYIGVEQGSRRSMTVAQPSITLDPTMLAGEPVIRGTRLSVES